MDVIAHTTTDPASTMDAIGRPVSSMDRDVRVYDIATMDEQVQGSMSLQRFAMTMLGSFVGTARSPNEHSSTSL